MSNGSFSGNPHTEWLSDSADERNMRLLADFSYTDPGGRSWPAPSGSVIDGASIPRTLWAAVGSPYTGNYRRASIVHDIAVRDSTIPRNDADRMFYFACLAGGCSLMQAKLLYAGVRIGGWVGLRRQASGARLPGEHTPTELEVQARYTLLALELGKGGDVFDDIEATVDRHLNAAPLRP